MDQSGTGLQWRAREAVVTALVAHVPALAVVGLFALAHLLLIDERHVQLTLGFVPLLGELIPLAAIFLAGLAMVGFVLLLFMPVEERSPGKVWHWLATRRWFEIALLRVPLALLVVLAVGFYYLSFKINIPSFVPYSWDLFFAELDRMLFLGRDPWVVTHGLLPGTLATRVLDKLYTLWFPVTQMTAFAVALLPLRSRLRLTYLTAYGLTWIVGGVVLAIVFSSAGPVYMEALTGDATFAPLMERLYGQAGAAPLTALQTQEWLWAGYVEPGTAPYGISAFPSMHLALAATSACAAFGGSRVLGWVLTAFTVAMFVGSVHLAWHYAVDGIAGIALALVFWRLSDRVAGWWLARTGRAGVPGRTPMTAAAE